MTKEEREFLKKLTEEPTSVSVDLQPKSNSFLQQSFAAPNDSNEDEVRLKKKKPEQVIKSSLGLGFDPSGVEPESGFKPMVEGQGSSIPTLAFSVLDGAERPPVSPTIYDNSFSTSNEPESLDSQDYYYEVMRLRDLKDHLLRREGKI